MENNEIISKLSAKEKVEELGGKDSWYLFPHKELGLNEVHFSDGPYGIRECLPEDSLFAEGKESICFPTSSLTAASFDRELLYKLGSILGKEARSRGIHCLLGPAINIKRNPLCGRNFEYVSEDPYLTGELAASYIKGVEDQGVATSIKHFALNNQESFRMNINSVCDIRTMREIYLKGFEMAVKEAKPWTVMSSYNKINGEYTSESYDLLTTILREEWGFQGMVVTDWFGGRDAVAQVKAGNDLLMPGKVSQQEAIRRALEEGRLSMAELDRNVRRILELILRTPAFKNYAASEAPELKAHAALARRAAADGMVLLENRDKALPFSEGIKQVAVFGNTSYRVVAGGTGSGDVNEAYTVSLEEGLENAGYQLDAALKQLYVDYLNAEEAKIDHKKYNHVTPPRIPELELSDEILRLKACEADIALVTIGRNAGEYTDRKVVDDFNLCADEQKLLEKVSRIFHEAGKQVVVILSTGGVVETASWKTCADAILLAWQGGQESGNAVADLLSGKVCPSGKLPMTFPVRYEDAASSRNFPVIEGEEAVDIYREFYTGARGENRPNIDYTLYEEGIFVGYRYFDTFDVPVSYPFGYGLSYTQFKYSRPECREIAGGYEFTYLHRD